MTIQEIVIQYYPVMSAREIAVLHGVSPNSVAYWARKLRVAHTPDTDLRLRRKMADAAASSRTPESRLKRSRRMCRIWAVERFRAISGMPPKTRLTPVLLPRRVRGAIYRLRTRYDYFSDLSVADRCTLFYDAVTRRTPNEPLFAARYGLRFLPADEPQPAPTTFDKKTLPT